MHSIQHIRAMKNNFIARTINLSTYRTKMSHLWWHKGVYRKWMLNTSCEFWPILSSIMNNLDCATQWWLKVAKVSILHFFVWPPMGTFDLNDRLNRFNDCQILKGFINDGPGKKLYDAFWPVKHRSVETQKTITSIIY
jgi:hypothetical protein